MRKNNLGELAKLTEAKLIGDPNYVITGVEDLNSATPEDASFLANPKYIDAAKKSKAGVICMDSRFALEEGKNYLLSDNPSRCFQLIVETLLITEPSAFTGIHPSAVIDPSVKIGKNVTVGPCAVIDRGVEIGDNTEINAHVFIGAGVTIGQNCHFHTHVSIRERCIIGNHVILQPGCVIGSCGFGYTTDAKGNHTKLDQLGIVIIEDNVEIGANTTIDRARFKATKIGKGTKIDNLVQIAHNVQLGRDNIIVSQTGIAGSAKTGKNVVLGGQAGVVGHVEICDYAMIATRGGVSKSVTEPGKYNGAPIMPLDEYNRQQVQLRKIGNYIKQIGSLEKRIKDLEEKTTQD